jgi:hypothetical protein
VGRAAELELLSDWAQPADPTQLLLFEAIGGNGKPDQQQSSSSHGRSSSDSLE